MGTKRLLRLLALVALLGGVSMYYTTQIVPSQNATSTSEISAPIVISDEVTESDTASIAVPLEQEVTPVPEATQPAAVAGSLDADIAAIESLVDGTYDDSVLEASITSDGSAVLSESYDF